MRGCAPKRMAGFFSKANAALALIDSSRSGHAGWLVPSPSHAFPVNRQRLELGGGPPLYAHVAEEFFEPGSLIWLAAATARSMPWPASEAAAGRQSAPFSGKGAEKPGTFYNRRRLRKHIVWGYFTPHETRLRHQREQALAA